MSTATIPPLEQWKRWIPAPPVMVAWGILLGAFLWTYWNTLIHLVSVWYGTPDYGHGFVVPLFSAFLLWQRQEMVDPWPSRGSLWCIPFFLAFAFYRWIVLYLNFERDIDSLFPFLFGMTLALGGWKAFRWAWPSIAFLIFMVPLPAFVAEKAGLLLQRIATVMSVYALQTLGIPAIVRGDQSNVIQLSDPQNKLEVAQACSGLRMMTVFFAMCIGACFILREPIWKKCVLVASAVPIAILSNVARITVTGVLIEWVNSRVGYFFHDKLGVLMVVPAILLIWGELALLSALLIEPTTEGPLVFGEGGGASRRRKPTLAGFGPSSSGPSLSGQSPSGRGPVGDRPRRPNSM